MITLHWYTNNTAEAITAVSKRLEIVELSKLAVTPFSLPAASPSILANRDKLALVSYQRRVSLNIEVDDTSNRYRALMQKPQLVLKFSLPEYIDFPVGTWCEYQNEVFTLNSEKNLTKNGKRNITYNMTLGGDEDRLALYKMRNSVDGRLKYSMCAKPSELVEEVVKNLNQREGKDVWSVGTCIESTEKTVEFNHAYIDAALQSIADTFETEWEIVNHVVSLHKVEYFKDDPLPLSYGRGNGFVPGLGRTTSTDQAPIKRIYTQGGTRNIDRSKYGGAGSQFPEYDITSSELRLPPSQTLEYEGRTYKTDSKGYYVERTDKVSTAVKEDSLDCSEIYPSRVGTVSSVETVDVGKHLYDIIDTSIDFALNFNDYIIEGETPTIIFQSGMLAGKEFEFKYKHAQRRFEIVPQEIDGIIMPDPATGYMPVEGNEYAVFGIMLPKQYFFNNNDKTGAAWDMFREAAKKLYENEDPKFTFKGDLQGLWAKNNWLRVGGRLVVGGYILFSDEQFAKEGLPIRITGIKDYINTPYAPTLEISNSVTGSSIRSDIAKIENTEVVIGDTKQELIQFTKRRFRDARETIEMLEEAMLGDFTNSVSPIAVTTMAMLVGDESLQFDFVASKANPVTASIAPKYDQATKQLKISRAGLLHYTLGSKTLSASNANTLCWQMPEWVSPVLTDRDTRYYLYAIVNSEDTDEVGDYTLSTKAKGLHDDTGKYNLLVGILNSEEDDERSFVPLHGFTEILPGRITTERIVSSNGKNFFDLVNNAFHLGNDNGDSFIDWNNITPDTLTLKNATISDALKVLGEALIAGFYFSDTVIRSTMMLNNNQSAMTLDGRQGAITLRSSSTGGYHSFDSGSASTISINASTGEIEVRNSNGVSYVSASGVFCNNPRTNAMPSSSGYTHNGAIVGLGFGNNVSDMWAFDQEPTIVAGVYGRADNTGTAPAFGGFFYDLFAGGLTLKTKYVTDSNSVDSVLTLGGHVTQAIGLVNNGKVGKVYLTSEITEGKTLFTKQIGQGAMRFYPSSGHKIFDDISENEYYDCPEGWECKFTFIKFSLNGNSVSAWAVSRWKF